MRTLALAGAAAALAATTVTPAHAVSGYTGGCVFVATNSNKRISAQDPWVGVAALAVASTSGVEGVTASCDLRVNGASQGGPSASGLPLAAVDAEQISFTAGETDFIEMCETVKVGSTLLPTHCDSATVQKVTSTDWVAFDLSVVVL